MKETYIAPVTIEQRQMIFCVLEDEKVISRKEIIKRDIIYSATINTSNVSWKLIFHRNQLFR